MKLKAKIRDFAGTPNTGGTGSISGWGTKIPYSMHCCQKKKKQKYGTICNKTNVSPSNSYVETLSPSVLVFGGGAFGR